MQLLDGKAISQQIIEELRLEIKKLDQKPNLDIILVGDDPASKKYVEMKQSKADSIGIGGQIHHLPQESTTQDVLNKIHELNQNPETAAFMIQLPLPPQINTSQVLESIDPQKDADGLTATNLGRLFHRDPSSIASATALGVIKLLDAYQIDLEGKNIVQIGRSEEIGMPLLALLIDKNATVTICHTKTKDLVNICRQADILISATGKGKLINSEFIKENAIVIDVGLSLDPSTNKLIGDVDFEQVASKTSFITPVPGGVGPMTIASLLFNTVKICKRTKYNNL